jgi:acetyl esterase/lipase
LDESTLYPALRGFPRALLSVGTLDRLLDDSLVAARWAAAGNRAQLAIYPGGSHGNLLATPLAERARRGLRQVVEARG